MADNRKGSLLRKISTYIYQHKADYYKQVIDTNNSKLKELEEKAKKEKQ